MNFFKQKRIEQNLSIQDIVDNINYPISVIQAIENNSHNFLPKPYAYYCVKTYGQYLKVEDLEEIIEKYK